MTVFPSEMKKFEYGCEMHRPFAEAMNYTLERLSAVEVDGLPKFESHIVFFPCDRRGVYDRGFGSLFKPFKPDIAVMSIQDAYESHKLIQPDTPNLTRFIREITAKSPSGLPSWGPVLSAIELHSNDGLNWAELGMFTHRERQVSAVEDVDKQPDEKPDYSQPTIRKIGAFS